MFQVTIQSAYRNSKLFVWRGILSDKTKVYFFLSLRLNVWCGLFCIRRQNWTQVNTILETKSCSFVGVGFFNAQTSLQRYWDLWKRIFNHITETNDSFTDFRLPKLSSIIIFSQLSGLGSFISCVSSKRLFFFLSRWDLLILSYLHSFQILTIFLAKTLIYILI